MSLSGLVSAASAGLRHVGQGPSADIDGSGGGFCGGLEGMSFIMGDDNSDETTPRMDGQDDRQQMFLPLTADEAPENAGRWASCCQGERWLRRVVRRTIEDPSSGPMAMCVYCVLVGLILASTMCAALVTVEELAVEFRETFQVLEIVFTCVFTVEILVRIWTAPSCAAYWRSPFSFVDLLATLPFYFEWAYASFWPQRKQRHLTHMADSFRALRLIRLVRILRIAKMARHSAAVTVVLESLFASQTGLSILVLFLGMGTAVSGTLAYIFESSIPDTEFRSIPAAMWWALTTITTVGYGDMVPSTASGKLVGCATMVGGTLVVSVSVAIITSSFSEQYRRRSELAKIKQAKRADLLRAGSGEGLGCDMSPTGAGETDLIRRLSELEHEMQEVLARLDTQVHCVAMLSPRDRPNSYVRRGSMAPLHHGGELAASNAESILLASLRAQSAALFQAARATAERCSLLSASSFTVCAEPLHPTTLSASTCDPQDAPADAVADAAMARKHSGDGSKPFKMWPRIAHWA